MCTWKNMFPDNWQERVNDTWALGYAKLYEYIETNKEGVNTITDIINSLVEHISEGLACCSTHCE